MLFQPTIESVLNDFFDLDDITPLELQQDVFPSLATNVTSHILTSAMQTPLQVIRTRFHFSAFAKKARRVYNE